VRVTTAVGNSSKFRVVAGKQRMLFYQIDEFIQDRSEMLEFSTS